MRYRCVIDKQECVIEVELSSDRTKAMIFSADPEKEILYAYNADIDIRLVVSDPDAFAEHVARDAIAAYEEELAATNRSAKQREIFSGELTRLS